MVLRRAIADLLTGGKRVLPVSSTNIAVDNALAGVIDELKPPAGLLVRVGTPQLQEIASNAAVSLPRLKAARCRGWPIGEQPSSDNLSNSAWRQSGPRT